ncbi:hypothetical protein CEP51_007953 [Fusarium floridanum]|uniref:Uncharacterized protein n=1 Tax=Fusarium floridanum TaxID=1325733 RepID=A0A428RME8_9HYPO|nr:hypothetical protein CEP51_007953 [Fusarium floridanum]
MSSQGNDQEVGVRRILAWVSTLSPMCMTVPALIGCIVASEAVGATDEVALFSTECPDVTSQGGRAAEVLCVAFVSVLAASQLWVLNGAVVTAN